MQNQVGWNIDITVIFLNLILLFLICIMKQVWNLYNYLFWFPTQVLCWYFQVILLIYSVFYHYYLYYYYIVNNTSKGCFRLKSVSHIFQQCDHLFNEDLNLITPLSYLSSWKVIHELHYTYIYLETRFCAQLLSSSAYKVWFLNLFFSILYNSNVIFLINLKYLITPWLSSECYQYKICH